MLTVRKKGFTLIELMIVVAIVAIIAAIAMPSYTRYAFRARRAEGRELAMRAAAAEERFYTNLNRYTSAVTGAAPSLGFAVATSENNYYTILVNGLGANNQTFTVRATPIGIQATDSCGQLTLNNTGAKGAPGDTGANGTCW
jgi:type IV pilus assembly protein PilE